MSTGSKNVPLQTLRALAAAAEMVELDMDEMSDIIQILVEILQEGREGASDEEQFAGIIAIDQIIGVGSAEQREERALNLLIDHPTIAQIDSAIREYVIKAKSRANLKLLFSRELWQKAQDQRLDDQVALRQAADAHAKRMEQENAELKRKLEDFTNAKNGGGEKRVKREKGAPKLAECRVCFESLVSGTKPSIIACSKCTDVRYHTRCAGEFKDRCVQCKEQTVARMTMVEVEELKRRQRAAGDDE
ncbi:hypothetical protein TeGR_g7761 [Tetraparma gracilis]|uniref:RING-type domain-containing protein n=1 Tax=Tetraparma gracilis TaxID=2962635 RepID=A0ABQ6MX85_9STRA|nr:hypothetical protein TeGR_g7761 [Tetraparma gracilis]